MKPKVILIVAAAQGNRVIGTSDNSLPWPRIRADMEHFRSVTLGSPVIMGRVTFETLPQENGFPKPLRNRQNIIITRNEDYIAPENVWVASSIEDAIKKAHTTQPDKICIIGGQQIYEAALGIADEIFYTEIKIQVEGTTTFPEIPSNFELAESVTDCEEIKFPTGVGPVEFEFQHWVRKK